MGHRKNMTDTSSQTVTIIEPRTDLVPPHDFSVIFMNDDKTTVEFVINVLVNIFHYDFDDATGLTIKIHEDGSAVVAVLPYEMAEQKALETTMLARGNNFPLNVKIEPQTCPKHHVFILLLVLFCKHLVSNVLPHLERCAGC